MIIGRSTGNLIFIRSSIFILRGFTPLSFAFIIIYLLVPTRLEIPKYATIPFLIEVLFYLFVFLPRKYYLQLPAVHPALLYRHQRKALLLRAIRLVADRDVFLRKWFNDAPISEIKRENVKEFYRWAFLNSLHAHEDTEEEVEEAIVEMETHFGRNFQPGYGDAKCLRLSFDPVGMQHRPFLMYMGIMLIDIFTHLYLLIQGYQFYRSSISRSLNTFPPRPLTFLTKNKSPVSKLTYWYRPGTSVTKRPIVFLHGIGVGLGPYFKLLAQLTKEGGENDDTPQIIAIEILPISSRMVSHISPMEEFCVEVEKILAFHGIADFCLVSHSYGSVLTSQLLKYDPVSTRIASVVLMDPVTILLLFPDVAYNFTRRKPNLANEHELYYFASQDMGVSHTLARHFFWYQNLVWKEDLLYRPEMYEGEGLRNRNVTVVLSGKDLIVNTQAVAAYLCCPDFPDWDNSEGCNWYLGVMEKPEQTNAWNSADGSMRVLWFGDLDHAQMLLKKEQSARVTREVLARASIKSGDVVNEGVNSF